MSILGNIIWLIFGGIVIAVEYFIGSIALMVTIIGMQHFKLAAVALNPFGRDIVNI